MNKNYRQGSSFFERYRYDNFGDMDVFFKLKIVFI